MTNRLPSVLVQRGFQDLGDCRDALPALADLLHLHSSLLQDFRTNELALLGGVMRRVKASAGEVLVQEGESGDWMLLLFSGTVDVNKQVVRDANGLPNSEVLEISRLAVARAGASLGEMSMLDSEPRNATCIALDDVEAGVLTRAGIDQLFAENPAVGSKLLINVTKLLAQRLRSTSAQLVIALAERKQREWIKS